MNTPLELVRVVDNQFEVVEETAKFLSKINEPVGVLSIVGLYRTGKSFLLNQLIEAQEKGFDVAHTVRPGTKGLWIWGNPSQVTNENNEKFRLITIDTEGIGSFSANETQDAQVFALALLLSSFFIYNSLGNIDDNAIQRLGVVTELSKFISRKGRDNSGDLEQTGSDDFSYDEIAQLLPTFLWVVRDFTLDLRNEEGRQISSQDYLEMALSPNRRNSDDRKNSKNRIKEMLRKCFPDRSCETMIRPVNDEKSLQKLSSNDKVSPPTLRPSFISQIRRLRRLIHSRIRPKTLGRGTGGGGTIVTGRMFVELVRNYCASMNTGRVVVDTCWTNVVKSEFDYSYITAKRYYKRKMMERLKSEGRIIEREPFESIHLEVETLVLKRFSRTFSFRSASDDTVDGSSTSSPGRKRRGNGPSKKPKSFDDHGVSLTLFREQQLYEHQLRKNIQKEKTQIWEGLKKASHQFCTRMIHRSLQKIEKGVSSMSYDSYISFEEDLASLLKHYQGQAKGCERGPVLLATLQKWVLPTIHSIHTSLMSEQSRKDEEMKNEILKNHISDIDTLKREHGSKMENLQKKMNALSKSKLELQKKHDSLVVKNREYESKLSEKDHRISELSRHLQQKEHSVRQNLSKLEKCQVDLSNQIKKYNESKKEHEEYKRSQEQKESDSYALRMEYDSVRVANESLRQTVEFLDLKNAQLTTSLTQYCDETTKLKFRCENLETTLSGCHETIRRQNEELSSSELSKNEVQEEVRTMKEEVRRLEREYKELEMKRDGLSSQLRLSSQHTKELRRQLRLEKEKVSDHEGRLRVTLAERDKLVRRSRAAVWERQVEQLNSTNRRILQINKKVMEENKILREEVIKSGGSVRTALLLNSSVLNSIASSTSSTTSATTTTTTTTTTTDKNDGQNEQYQEQEEGEEEGPGGTNQPKEISFFSEFIKKDSPHRIIRNEPPQQKILLRHQQKLLRKEINDPTLSSLISTTLSTTPNESTTSSSNLPHKEVKEEEKDENKITNMNMVSRKNNKRKNNKKTAPEIRKVIQKQMEEIAKERERNHNHNNNKNKKNKKKKKNHQFENQENQVVVSTIKSSNNHHQQPFLKKKRNQQQQQQQPQEVQNRLNIFLDDDDLSTLNYFEQVIRKSRKTPTTSPSQPTQPKISSKAKNRRKKGRKSVKQQQQQGGATTTMVSPPLRKRVLMKKHSGKRFGGQGGRRRVIKNRKILRN